MIRQSGMLHKRTELDWELGKKWAAEATNGRHLKIKRA